MVHKTLNYFLSSLKIFSRQLKTLCLEGGERRFEIKLHSHIYRQMRLAVKRDCQDDWKKDRKKRGKEGREVCFLEN